MDGDVGGVLRDCMVVMLKLGGPPLMITLVVGVVMALVQAVTQINETSLAFVPKVLALCVGLVLLGPFMFASLGEYTHQLFDRMIAIGGS